MEHAPVLLKEILDAFDPKPGECYIDATANGGGHLMALAERVGAHGKIIGIELDPDIFRHLEEKISKNPFQNIIIVNDSYARLSEIAKREKQGSIAGILFDLGISSLQLNISGKGFSFLYDEPLDMRFNPTATDYRASDIINHATRDELTRILKEYGEERFARSIADRIILKRKQKPIRTTSELVRTIGEAIPGFARKGKIHFATRTFQALRIAVNRELEVIQSGILAAIDTVAPGGKIAIVSFHSLEDRVVKHVFRDASKQGRVSLINKKPIIPGRVEIRVNPRSRSAKLRIAQKI